MTRRLGLTALAVFAFACGSPRSPVNGAAEADVGADADATGDVLAADGDGESSDAIDMPDVVSANDVEDARDGDLAELDAALTDSCIPASVTNGNLPMTSLDCIKTWDDYPCASLGLGVGQVRLVAALDLRFGGALADPCDPQGQSVGRVFIVGREGLLVATYGGKSGRLRITSTDAAGRPIATVGYDRWCNKSTEARGACCASGPTGNLAVEIDDTTLAFGFLSAFGHEGSRRMVVGMRDTPRWAAAAPRTAVAPGPGEKFRLAVFGANLHAQAVGFAPKEFEEPYPAQHPPALAAGSKDTLWMALIQPTTRVIKAFQMDDKLKPLVEVSMSPPADIMAELPMSGDPLRLANWGQRWELGAPIVEVGSGALRFHIQYSQPSHAAYLIATGAWKNPGEGKWKADIRNFPLLLDETQDAILAFWSASLCQTLVGGLGLVRTGARAISFLDAEAGIQGMREPFARNYSGSSNLQFSAINRASAAILIATEWATDGTDGTEISTAAAYCAHLPGSSKESMP